MAAAAVSASWIRKPASAMRAGDVHADKPGGKPKHISLNQLHIRGPITPVNQRYRCELAQVPHLIGVNRTHRRARSVLLQARRG